MNTISNRAKRKINARGKESADVWSGSPVPVLEGGHTELPGSKHEKGNKTSVEKWFRGQLIEQGRPVCFLT